MRNSTRFFRKKCFQVSCSSCFKKCFQSSCTNCFPVSSASSDVPLEPPPTHSDSIPEVKGSPSSPPPFCGTVSRNDLEKALTHIKQRLSELDTKSISDQGGIVDLLAERGSSLLEAISKYSEDSKSKIPARADSDAVVGLLVKLLGGLGSLHWAAAGLSLIAVAFKTYEDASGNQKVCLDMLTRMVEVLELLKEVWEPEQKHEKALQRITGVLILSAANCCSLLCRSWPYRMFFASAKKDDLADLRKTLQEEFQVLQLIISTNAKEQATKPYVQLGPKSPTFAIGLNSKTDKVMELLQLGVHDKPVRAVCLQGMGGIGKSTLGDAVHTKVQIQGGHCKVQLLAGQTDDLTKRQQEIMEKLLKSGCERIGNEDEGRELMRKKFLELKLPIFIFLDNMQSKEQVHKLLPDGDCFPVGSAILVTTRDKDVHNALAEKNICSELFVMEVLPQNEAKELLYMWIRKGNEIQESSFEEVRAGGCEERLLGACSGLPLALKVTGAYIGKTGPDNKQVWETVIAKLGEGEAPSARKEFDMYSSLMFSIQGLTEEAQGAFLDIVAFYLYKTWEDVQCYVGRELLDILEERALVEMSKDTGDYFGPPSFDIRIHDVLKGLGHRLIEEREDQLRITSERQLLDVLEESNSDPSILRKIRGISLWEGEDLHQLSAIKLEKMRNLRILSLSRPWEIDGVCKRTPKKLRYITLERGRWPFEGRVSASDIRLSDIDNVEWELLSEVKLLIISHSTSLTNLAQIPNSVERLRLWHCDSLTNNADAEGIQRFSSLTYLRVGFCPLLRALPVDAPRLRHLIIQYCENFREFPSTMTSLQWASLQYCESLEELPDAVQLELEECPNLRTLPTDFLIQASSESKSFSFAEFRQIRELPQSLGRLSLILQELDLEACEHLETLPEEFGCLKSLGFLNLSRCSNLKRLPNSFSKLGSLKVLNMRNCVRLETLPQDLGELHSLSVLDLKGAPIQQLPSSLGDLQCLAFLDLSDCVNLEELSTGLTQLSSLQILLLRRCGSMTCVPQGLLQMKCLRYVDIRGCSLQLEESEQKQSRGPLVVSSRLMDNLEHGTKTGSVEELLLQRVLYDVRGEPAELRDNNIVGLVFQQLDGGSRLPKGSFDFCRIADQKRLRAGKQPQFIYIPHVLSWSPDWRWDDYKRTVEFGPEDVPDDLPDEWLRAIHPHHGTALFTALQDGAYYPIHLGERHLGLRVDLVFISLDKGPAHSWFDLFRLLPHVGNPSYSMFSLFEWDIVDEQSEIVIVEESEIAQVEQRRANVSRNSLLVTDQTDYVVSNYGKQLNVAALEGKIVGVYFCSFPPEESFTLILKDVYHNLKDTEQPAFEVVWIPSHDCPVEEICKCCGDMPWPSLPACNARSLQALILSSHRDPSPALVVFDGEGTLLQANAFESCKRFGSRAYPFTDERIAELLEEEGSKLQSQPTLWTLLDDSGFLIARGGSKVGVKSLKGKTVGLLYLPYSLSEEKCDSLFVQKLIARYEEILVSREQALEIVAIFCGVCSEEGFASSVQAMPWLALPLGDALRLTWKAKELLEVWRGESTGGDIDENLSRWRWLRCYPVLRKRECLVMFDGEGNIVMRGCGEDIASSDACQFMGMPAVGRRSLCISKAYGLPSTICHPSHPQHPISINAARPPVRCDLCNTMCDLQVSYACVECDYDLCLDPCSKF